MRRLLKESDDKGAGAGERVQDMDALIGQRLAELCAEEVVGGAEDEVDDFDWGIHDA